MATQQRTRKINISTYMASRAFQDGVKTVRKGLPWPSDYEKLSPNEQWKFETGRMFGILAPKELNIKLGRRITPEAIRFFIENKTDLL